MAAKRSRADQLDRLAAQQRRLQEQDRKLQERIRKLKASESQDERRRDTRRKILIGSLVLAQVDAGRRAKAELLSELDAYLTEDRDRVLFGLAPRSTESSEATTGGPLSATTEEISATERPPVSKSSTPRDDRSAAHA